MTHELLTPVELPAINVTVGATFAPEIGCFVVGALDAGTLHRWTPEQARLCALGLVDQLSDLSAALIATADLVELIANVETVGEA